MFCKTNGYIARSQPLIIGQFMNLDRPSASGTQSILNIDHQQDVAVAAASVGASAAASASAAAAPATTRDALAAASTSTSAPAEEYVAPFADDMLGIIAGYLPSEDQLALRRLNRVATAQTDRQMETLSLTTKGAIALFRDGANLSHLKRLSLSDFDAPTLAEFAEVLSTTKYLPFELVLTEEGWDQDGLETDTLRRLSTLPLSGLTLQPGHGFPLSRTSALAHTAFPVSLNLDHVSFIRDFDAVTRIHRLTSLSMENRFPSSVQDATALGSHGLLTAFKGGARLIQPDVLLPLLANPHLKTLSLTWILQRTDEVAEVLERHPSITSLEFAVIQHPALLAAILRNPIISSLKLTPYCLHPSEMHHIAEMPSLRNFTLLAGDERSPEPDTVSIEALCSKALDMLSFDEIKMSEATLGIAARAHATSLTLRNNKGTLDQAAIAALVANPHVTTFTFAGSIIAGGAAQLAAAPGLQTLSLEIVSAEETVESVQRVWRNAGRSLEHLNLTLRVPDADVVPNAVGEV